MGTAFMTFPLEQIGWGLRQLSLSGAAGNILAIIIYVGISFIPCGVYCLFVKKKKNYKVDLFLPFLSILLFVVIYFMINPGLIQTNVPEVGKSMLCSGFYSVLFGYLILRILKTYTSAEPDGLKKGIRILLAGLMILFVFVIIYEFCVTLPFRLQSVQEGNSVYGLDIFMETPDLTMTYIFLVLQSILNALPYLLDILVVYQGIQLLSELLVDSYSEKAVALAEKLGDLCAKALGIILISGMIFNLLQLLCHAQLYQINMNVSVPLFSILFVLGVFLLARYIRENQKLKQDNDLFI